MLYFILVTGNHSLTDGQMHAGGGMATDESGNELSSGEGYTLLPLPVQQFYIFTLLWQFIYKVSNAAVTTLLRFMK